MSNVGRAAQGKVLTAKGNTLPPSFLDVGQLSGLTEHTVVLAQGTNAFTTTAVGNNGQVIIGATGADPAFATLTSSNGSITFTPGINSLSMVVASGAGFQWTDISGAFSPVKNNGYFITGTATGTLPASPSQGDTIQFFVDHATQDLTIQASGTQIIRMGSTVTGAGGTAVSTAQGDSCTLVYRSSNTCWESVGGFSGVWSLT